jgi:hypothetical protein
VAASFFIYGTGTGTNLKKCFISNQFSFVENIVEECIRLPENLFDVDHTVDLAWFDHYDPLFLSY